jgi:hypothetical protein
MKKAPLDRSRRIFLQTVGTGVPTLTLMLRESDARAGALAGSDVEASPGKFTPVDLSGLFNSSATDFGPRDRAKGLSGDPTGDGLIRMPAGRQVLRGIPFQLGPEGIDKKSRVALSARKSLAAAPSVSIPLGKRARFICLAQFCDYDENETPPPDVEDVVEKIGQRLARAVLVYDNGEEKTVPLRRRFEVNSPSISSRSTRHRSPGGT